MHTIGKRRRPTDIRKCAMIAAVITAISVVALELAGSTLKGSYSGLDGTLSPANSGRRSAVAPAGVEQ
jgi:hypothetical protein